MTTNHFIDKQEVESSKYQERIEKYDGSEVCFICGKKTSSSSFVHYTTHGYLTDLTEEQLINHDMGDSQGLFPIGSECSKKLPASFIF